MKTFSLSFICALCAHGLAAAAGVLEVSTPGYNTRSAEYTTSHVYVDEVAGTTADITFIFDPPGSGPVGEVELFTNLNRRDLARTDKNGDLVPDGIVPIDGNVITSSAADSHPVTGHYYAAFPMTYDAGNDHYTLTIAASKTGAYRANARFRANPTDPWTWWGLRDHAIVVAPTTARNINVYEINVFNIEADGDQFVNRSTIEDLHNAPNATHNANNRWDLDYLTNLGCNWLWFQPIHPNGIDGREPSGGYDTPTPPYDPGSPYAVKNFFEVNALMSVEYDGTKTTYNGDPIDPTMHPDNRAAAMQAWQDFTAAADAKGVGLMLDAPFNHTAFDVELGQPGVDLFQPDGSTWSPLDEIRNREARFFSRDYNPGYGNGGENYGDRAPNAAEIAPGPDRYDFGKWRDVKDVYFGRYDALVEFDSEPERSSYTNEGDWFDFSDPEWNATDFTQNSNGFNVTHRVWDYFAEYALHWIEVTRPPGQFRNSTPADGDAAARYAWDRAGVDGLRCDFGQGLPPRAWEYIMNVARSKKWNFVMMSESLDGGNVTYRSARHFEVLNENIVFPLKSAADKFDYRNIFEGRRNAYGQALVLTNTTSHDEENYADPWQAVVRTAVTASLDGLPMIFPGQELGISTAYGYDHYEVNFGKQIPHFKRWNSMQPIWNDTNFGNDQLYPVYSGMLTARLNSPALRSSNRWFLDGDGGNDQIHAVAKYETPNAAPAVSDVVLAFANLDRNTTHSDNFKIPGALAPLLGLEDGRIYNSKNIAAYTAQQSNRRDLWLWGNGISGADLKSSGFFVQLYRVPVANSDWLAEPYEAQYLKLYDITAPSATGPQGQPLNAFGYAIDGSTAFDWDDLPADAGGVVPAYEVNLTIDGQPSGSFVTSESEAVIDAEPGQQVSVTITPVNPDFNANKGTIGNASSTVQILAPDADHDEDGQSNLSEDAAGVNPMDGSSFFAIKRIESEASGNSIFIDSVEGRSYTLESSSTLAPDSWTVVGASIPGTGAELSLPDASSGGPYYRVRVTR